MQLNSSFRSDLRVRNVSERVYQDLITKPSNLCSWGGGEGGGTSCGITAFGFEFVMVALDSKLQS